MSDIGMKVSAQGHDVSNADDKDLLLKTDFTLLKVFASGSVQISGGSWGSIVHNLGYVPQFLVWAERAANDNNNVLATASWTFAVARADTSRVYFKVPTGSGGNQYTIYYYIFYEDA